jgi:hypothetical protein
MSHDDMETLVGFLKGAFPKLTEDQVELYSAMLMSEDAALASRAILDGIKEWKFPPTWAEIHERIAALKRAAAPVPANPISVDVEDYQIPRWVRRWCYARYLLKPPDLRLFQESYPLQWAKGDTPVEGWMPPDEYAREAQQVSDDMVRVAVAQTAPKATLKELLGGP